MVPTVLLLTKSRACEQTQLEEGPVQPLCTCSLNLAVRLVPLVGTSLMQPELYTPFLGCFYCDIYYFFFHEVQSPVKKSDCSRIASELGLRSQCEQGPDAAGVQGCLLFL